MGIQQERFSGSEGVEEGVVVRFRTLEIVGSWERRVVVGDEQDEMHEFTTRLVTSPSPLD